MFYSELAHRYAVAIYDIAKEAKATDAYLKALEQVQSSLEQSPMIKDFVHSPLVRTEEKSKTVIAAFKDSGLPEDVTSFITLLAQKGRLAILPEIIAAYQAREDETNGVTRGVVKSSKSLSDKQKDEMAKLLSSITNKKVILQYENDKSLIGGLTAQVGSLTFDDSISAHIRRIKEDLTRRIN
ncbi:MAG: ATP synthase F1 subunit delta [Bdellovibrionales bacterium]|nr:ATP synthase F1 subunit delta [Bdellovibrionales bacterium]